jgi:glutamate-1-semialdehyde aminotransferase
MHVQSSQSDWISRGKAVLPGWRVRQFRPSVIIREGKGSRVWDEDGKEYVDYLIGSGPMLLGHGHPEVLEAVLEQLPKGMTFFANNAAGIELAEEICRAVPRVPNRCAMSRPAARPTCTRCGWPAPSPGARRSSNSRAAITACRRKRR